MTQYISYLPIEYAFNDELSHELKQIRRELIDILPRSHSDCSINHIETQAKRNFLKLMEQLERLYFINAEDDLHRNFATVIFSKYDTIFKEYTNTPVYNTGFFLKIAPKTHYEEYEGVKHLEVLEKELKDQPNQFLKIYTNKNKLFIFTNKQPTWLQLIKLKILQWTLFETQIHDPEPNIMRFLKGMLNNDLNEINTALTNIMTRPDFAELKYKNVIKVLEYGSQSQIRSLKSGIETVQEDITNYENRLNDSLTQLRNLNIALAAAENAPKEDMQLIIKYLVKHPYIKSFTTLNDTSIEFKFEAPLIYFDKYILEKIKNKKRDSYKQILEIFEHNNYELITRCKIIFDAKNFKVSFNRIGAEPGGIIGHPHMDTYSCFGNHNRALQDAAKEGNYLGAIEQLSQAVLNINFADTYVIDTLLNLLTNEMGYYRTWKCKETGAMLTTEEVLNNEEASSHNE